jgi:hypothetical protein
MKNREVRAASLDELARLLGKAKATDRSIDLVGVRLTR